MELRYLSRPGFWRSPRAPAILLLALPVPPQVTTSYASVAPVSEAVYGTGTVEPERWAKVVPLQRRRLVELCRCEGQVVRVGQVLGRQDDAEERSALDQMEINRGQLERDLGRAEKDRDEYDAARADMSSAGPAEEPHRGSPRRRCTSNRCC